MNNTKHNKIIIGSANFGNNYGKFSKKKKLNKKRVFEILKYAQKRGINTVDTSVNYGDSYEIIKSYNKFKKKKIKINTKIDQSYISLKKGYQNFKNNLDKNLNLIQSHNSKDIIKKKQYYELFINLQKKFKIGISVYEINETIKVLKIIKPNVLQIPFNIFNQQFFNKKFISHIKKNNIKLHARSIFLQGLLFKDTNYMKKKFTNLKNSIEKYDEIANELGVNLADLSVIYVNSLNFISNVIIGFENKKQLKKVINLLEKFPKLKPKIIKKINSISKKNKTIIDPRFW